MMLLPAHRQNQLSFLPDENIALTCLAQRRVYVGDFFERASAALLNTQRLTVTTKADICPDLEKDGVYFESKSVGASEELVIRQFQYEREKQFCEKNMLWHILWHHISPVNEAKTSRDLYTGLKQNVRKVIIIPSALIHTLCAKQKLTEHGYRLRLPMIFDLMGYVQDKIVWELYFDSHTFGPLVVSCPAHFPFKDLL